MSDGGNEAQQHHHSASGIAREGPLRSIDNSSIFGAPLVVRNGGPLTHGGSSLSQSAPGALPAAHRSPSPGSRSLASPNSGGSPPHASPLETPVSTQRSVLPMPPTPAAPVAYTSQPGLLAPPPPWTGERSHSQQPPPPPVVPLPPPQQQQWQGAPLPGTAGVAAVVPTALRRDPSPSSSPSWTPPQQTGLNQPPPQQTLAPLLAYGQQHPQRPPAAREAPPLPPPPQQQQVATAAGVLQQQQQQQRQSFSQPQQFNSQQQQQQQQRRQQPQENYQSQQQFPSQPQHFGTQQPPQRQQPQQFQGASAKPPLLPPPQGQRAVPSFEAAGGKAPQPLNLHRPGASSGSATSAAALAAVGSPAAASFSGVATVLTAGVARDKTLPELVDAFLRGSSAAAPLIEPPRPTRANAASVLRALGRARNWNAVADACTTLLESVQATPEGQNRGANEWPSRSDLRVCRALAWLRVRRYADARSEIDLLVAESSAENSPLPLSAHLLSAEVDAAADPIDGPTSSADALSDLKSALERQISALLLRENNGKKSTADNDDAGMNSRLKEVLLEVVVGKRGAAAGAAGETEAYVGGEGLAGGALDLDVEALTLSEALAWRRRTISALANTFVRRGKWRPGLSLLDSLIEELEALLALPDHALAVTGVTEGSGAAVSTVSGVSESGGKGQAAAGKEALRAALLDLFSRVGKVFLEVGDLTNAAEFFSRAEAAATVDLAAHIQPFNGAGTSGALPSAAAAAAAAMASISSPASITAPAMKAEASGGGSGARAKVLSQLALNRGLLFFAKSDFPASMRDFEVVIELERLREWKQQRGDHASHATTAAAAASAVWRPEGAIGIGSDHSLLVTAANNLAIAALYSCDLRRALGVLEATVKEDPAGRLFDVIAFNLCTLYDLGGDADASATRKCVLQATAARFGLDDIDPASFRLS